MSKCCKRNKMRYGCQEGRLCPERKPKVVTLVTREQAAAVDETFGYYKIVDHIPTSMLWSDKFKANVCLWLRPRVGRINWRIAYATMLAVLGFSLWGFSIYEVLK